MTTGIVHISEAANIGLHSMILLAGEPARSFRAREVATALGVSEDHLSKVLLGLVRAGMVVSTRGPRGGFKLGRPAASIKLLAIYETIEGELRHRACLLAKPRCDGGCILGDFVADTNAEFRRRFAGTTLADVAGRIRSENTNETQAHRDRRVTL